MEAQKLLDALADSPVIAAVKNDGELERALESDVAVLFLLYGTLVSLPELTRRVHDAGKLAFVHLDLVEGLAAREVAVDFVRANTAADGVISTKANLTRRARELGLVAIQRYFLLDSRALHALEQQFHPANADVVEVLPGLMPKIIAREAARIGVPVIAGGLIRDKEDVTGAFSAGAVAVSSTNPDVWNM